MNENTAEGLRGIRAGNTSICTVGAEGHGLHYRGYAIEDLAENSCFEEVVYLLMKGELPTQNQLDDWCEQLRTHRQLPGRPAPPHIHGGGEEDRQGHSRLVDGATDGHRLLPDDRRHAGERVGAKGRVTGTHGQMGGHRLSPRFCGEPGPRHNGCRSRSQPSLSTVPNLRRGRNWLRPVA